MREMDTPPVTMNSVLFDFAKLHRTISVGVINGTVHQGKIRSYTAGLLVLETKTEEAIYLEEKSIVWVKVPDVDRTGKTARS